MCGALGAGASSKAQLSDELYSIKQIGFIFLALQLPALRALTKYFPSPELTVPLFLLFALCGTVLVIRPPWGLTKILGKPWPALVVLAAFTVWTVAIYPYADGLKLQGRGSDADDALILASQALLKFQSPYDQETYLGNLIAPGPGWALLAAPFSVSGLYSLFFPSTLALAFWCLRSCGTDWPTLNRFAVLLASSLLVWELAAVGSDYLPFVMLVLVATLLLKQPNLHRFGLIGIIFLTGLLATFRIVFIFLPLLVGFSLLALFPRRALAVALGGLTLALTVQVVFLLLNPSSYPPLSLLLQKANAIFSFEGLTMAIAVCVATAMVMLVNWRTWRPITHLAVGLAVPWALVAAADLVRVHGSLPDWGGASFLAIPLPFVVLALISSSE